MTIRVRFGLRGLALALLVLSSCAEDKDLPTPLKTHASANTQHPDVPGCDCEGIPGEAGVSCDCGGGDDDPGGPVGGGANSGSGNSPGAGGVGGGGNNGSGNGGTGQGTGPTSIPNMPQTMPRQITAGSCVPSSLAQVKLALCGGNQTAEQIESAMLLYGIQQYGINFPNEGVPLSDISGFINHFFNTTILNPAGNVQGAINAGYPIMIDVFSHMDGPGTAVYHSVVITGYDPADVSKMFYLDPGTGRTHQSSATTLFANTHYAIPITGCK